MSTGLAGAAIVASVMSVSARPLPMSAFAAATLLPAALLGAGACAGGWWLVAGVVALFAVPLVFDQLLPMAADAGEGVEFPAADALLVVLAVVALVLPLVAVSVVASGRLEAGEIVALLAGCGLWLGQIAHPAAHELIHRSDRRLFRLGVVVYSALLIGHHASSHRLIHHRHVATRDDPATARRGEGFWRFALRAGAQGFRRGYAAEAARGARVHPYAVYGAISLCALGAAALVGGFVGVAVWVGLALHAQMQIHLSDYVQHYGLVRRVLPDGRPEPVGAAHSWNSAHWLSSALLLNAPRHSDHHANPARPYPALRLDGDAPRLPWPLPLAALVALVPPVWRRLMAPHLAAHLAAVGRKRARGNA